MTTSSTSQMATDRANYDAWVQSQLLRIATYGEAGNGFNVWDTSKLRRARKTGMDDADAYRGRWVEVRKYATQEFIWWVEAEGNPRWTFTAWLDAMRRDRKAAADARDDKTDAIGTLEYLRDMQARLGEFITAARDAGSSWAEITAASGLSRMTCHTLAKNHAAPAMADDVDDSEIPF